jgi:hypothetical protein
VKWISASAWKLGPSARIRHAWSGRGLVLSETSGGIETEYWAHGDACAASFVASRSQSVAA